jgi:chromosome segregation ATPase
MSSVPKIAADPSEEEARAQNAALIEDLKEQLQKAETASEQYQKQLGVLQMRLDEAVSEQTKLEDQGHERDSKIEALNGEIRDHVRQIRDLEQAHELERNAMLQEKEQQASREEEMQATIQRLKEAVAQKDMRISAENDKNVSRSCEDPRTIWRLHGDELIILQPASATEPLQILTDSLRRHLKSNGAHRGTTLNYFCRRISLSSPCD